MPDALAAALRLRQFNRFYTRRLGLLNAGHLRSPFSLAEVRVLYELAHREQPTASDVATALDMDEGYLSRLLRRLRQQSLVRARAAPHDGRERWLGLTAKGRKAFATLDARATDSVVGLIQDLAPPEQQRLVGAVTTVEALLDGAPTESPPASADAVELRSPAPGDLGWVVQRHGELYSREYGWNVDFERLVARIVGEFAAAPAGPVQQCWIATVGGRRAGCVFLMPGAQPDVARLRLLLVEPWARGHKLGTRLVARCIDAARQAGCMRLTLWTNGVLVAARRIYERAGFHLTHSERHQSFGKSLVGQTWDLTL
jgi:DNA-binding MarR family transcriptional regulator/N-acetylglutamate synthase-like GNAT family acetyltransferase